MLAGLGNADALFNLAILAEDGLGEPPDLAKAERDLRAAGAGGSKAQYRLGLLYSSGGALPRDLGKTRRYFALAADNGDDDAADRLAALEQPERALGDFEQVEVTLPAAASTARAAAFTNAPRMPATSGGDAPGLDLRSRPGRAARPRRNGRRFTAAVEAGDAEAQYALAVMYRTGKGQLQDRQRSLEVARARRRAALHPAANAALAAERAQRQRPPEPPRQRAGTLAAARLGQHRPSDSANHLPMQQPARACGGIDFGTSNSTVGWLRPGAPTLLPLEDGKATSPRRYCEMPTRTPHLRPRGPRRIPGLRGRLMRALKSLLGSSLIDGQTEVHGRALRFRTCWRASSASSRPRRGALGGVFEQAVFRPTGAFRGWRCRRRPQGPGDARGHRPAGGVSRRELPVRADRRGAALRAFACGRELVLIADIGGGTADFSIVRLSPERARGIERHEDLLGNAGIHIGGTDFDRALSLECVMPLLGYRGQMKNGAQVPASIFFQLATWAPSISLHPSGLGRPAAHLSRRRLRDPASTACHDL